VSGAGRSAVEQLARQTASLLNGRPLELAAGTRQIAFNAVPHIDAFQENRYTKEEMKMLWETQKIFEDESIAVNATAVRIPVFYGHSEAVHLETRKKITAADVCRLLREAPGVTLIDGVAAGEYPTAVSDASGTDPVFVGRVREDISHPRGINMWIVSDNIRKGAALNSVQIAEILAKNYL
jgi:aspartate-semialdehyde dehydrogenase